MSEHVVSLTVDGVEVKVPAGTPVIQAAERAGSVVPHYCYHPGIPSRPAQCRMCLVEIEGQPKLQPSCVMIAQEGMIVHTQSEQALEARRSVIEFLLLNHPLDCPICDAAGQCMLQDYAYETGQLSSRYEEPKLVLGRDRIAEDILYFADRCIICTRCVRFMEDIAGDNSLVVAQRGHKAYIDTFPGQELEHAFRGNIVDVCPVGALVHEDFVFKARAWDMDTAPGICAGCSQGCNIEVNVKENQVVRVKPRYNADVNGYWMCDEGRRHLVMANRGLRLDVPMIRRGDVLEAVTWSEAIEWIAASAPWGAGGVAVVHPGESNETLFALRELIGALGIAGGGYRMSRGEEVELPGFPRLKLRQDRAPNGAGAELFGFSETDAVPVPEAGQTLLVAGDRLLDAGSDYGAQAGFYVYLGTHMTEGASSATVILPLAGAGEADGTYVNFDGLVQRFHQAMQPPGVARPGWMVIDRLLREVEPDRPPMRDVAAAFGSMAAATPELEGLSWRGLGLKGGRTAGRATVTGAR
ncbi:MAG: 2Fe-2S iron-sulfur cluster-binding protein [Gemmatimonadota bacterium]|nr:2Fe-2S iron-sulfur cluster-binding protein [Gemmatimonadota bacterium]